MNFNESHTPTAKEIATAVRIAQEKRIARRAAELAEEAKEIDARAKRA